MRRFIAILAVLAWIPTCWQPLRGESPGIGVNARKKQKQQPKLGQDQTQTNQTGTQNSPLVVDILSHPKGEREAAEDKRKDDQRDFRDRWTFRIAIAAAIFTGLLVYVGWRGVCVALRTLEAIEAQANLMERQTTVMERQTTAIEGTAIAARDNAEAAKGQIEAVIAANRPWLLPSKIEGMYLTPADEFEPAKCFRPFVAFRQWLGRIEAHILSLYL